MSTFYNAAADRALASINEFGQSIPLTRRGTDSEFDPISGRYTSTGEDLTATLKAVVLPLKKGQFDEQYQAEFAKGNLRGVLAAAAGVPFVPEIGDTVEIEDATWEVFGVTSLAPGGIAVTYRLGVRRR